MITTVLTNKIHWNVDIFCDPVKPLSQNSKVNLWHLPTETHMQNFMQNSFCLVRKVTKTVYFLGRFWVGCGHSCSLVPNTEAVAGNHI